MLEALQIVFGLLLNFFLPGFFLIMALFPRKGELDKEFDLLYKITLGIGMSVVIVILNGFFLGNVLPLENGKGQFTATNIWISLSVISLVFFIIGWYRGAYQFLAKIHPSLLRTPAISIDVEAKDSLSLEIQEFALQREDLRRQLKNLERFRQRSRMAERTYETSKKKIKEELIEVEKKILELEEERARQMAENQS